MDRLKGILIQGILTEVKGSVREGKRAERKKHYVFSNSSDALIHKNKVAGDTIKDQNLR